MAVSITTIQGTDNVALSRLTINSNFSALKAASDAVTALLDPSTYTLSGVKSIQVENSASPLSATILSVGKGAAIMGNLTLGTVAQPTTVSIIGTGGVSIASSSITIGTGNLSLSSETSLLSLGGNMSIAGQYRSTGLSMSKSNMISLTASSTPVSVAGAYNNKYVFVTNGSTASTAPLGVSCSLVEGTAGQVIEIYHVLGPSGPVKIDTTNFTGLTGPIQLNCEGDVIKCVYEGGYWNLWEAIPAEFATGPTYSVPSIEYTRTSGTSTYIFPVV